MFKVLTRPLHSKNAYKTFKEFDTLEEAMATAARLERNASDLVDIIVELPDNQLQAPSLSMLELTA